MSGKRAKTLRKSAAFRRRARAHAAVDVQSTVPNGPDLQGKPAGENPRHELGNDGQIRAVLDKLVSLPVHDPETGQFVRGMLKTGEHSEAFWAELQPVK